MLATWFDVNISAENSIIHPHSHNYCQVWKDSREFSFKSQVLTAEVQAPLRRLVEEKNISIITGG